MENAEAMRRNGVMIEEYWRAKLTWTMLVERIFSTKEGIAKRRISYKKTNQSI